jgi:hypothetical protein
VDRYTVDRYRRVLLEFRRNSSRLRVTAKPIEKAS